MRNRGYLFKQAAMLALVVASLFAGNSMPAAFAAPNLQGQLYQSCTEKRGITPTPTTEAPQATAEVTAAATIAGPGAVATPANNGDLTFYRIAGADSEACYQVGEIFIDEDNSFNLAVGVTKSIDGQIAIDKNHLANSVIGDIVINVSEFKSDSPRRDGIIRERWLESNKYPLAKLTDSRVIGLEPSPYSDGEILSFQVIGNLEVHGNKKETAFYTQAWLKDDALVVIAYANVKMTDFGFDPPSIVGLIKANNDARLVLNLVARVDRTT